MDTEVIKKEIEVLNQVITKATRALYKCPEGSLRISYSEKKPIFFQRDENGNEKYLKSQEKELVKNLANKDYNVQVIKQATKQRDHLVRLLKTYKPDLIKSITENLHPIRKELVLTYELSDKDYARKWQELKYSGGLIKDSSTTYRTAKGETVRSKSEVIIADRLKSKGVPYRYEYPHLIKGMGQIHPDFTVLNVKTRQEFIWEHFGMMDNLGYFKNAMEKLLNYAESGFFQGVNLITTQESSDYPLRTEYIDFIIDKFLKP